MEIKLTSLVAATFNTHKVTELQALFAPWQVSILSLAQFTAQAPEESGETFLENALIKARYGYKVSGQVTLADDSGLEVDALKGAPGVYSARFAGIGAEDVSNYQKLLQDLKGNPDRRARFRCVLALVGPEGELVADGACEGLILEEPRGKGGFGYDPVFLLPDLGKSMAEVEGALKNQISHRARAFQNLIQDLGEKGWLQ